MSVEKHGFTTKEVRFVKELDASVTIYHHSRSGARLIHIDANDDNKVFSIGFRTPSNDSTGVAHIIEHSLLCGSEKYPSKEPFVELLKGSLYTFLNAFTSSDFTSYPVASMNDKDFKILMSVYLDAVFFPNIRKIDEIFYQEGWHYELNDKDDELTIKGVVYNEMQGAYSDPSRIFYRHTMKELFPDTGYRFCSGGYPDNITDLSLQQFRDFHKKYYHPSNSYIYLYGKMNIDEMLEIINNEALKKFIATDVDSDIEVQTLFSKPVESECFYPIAATDDETDKTWFSIDFIVNVGDDPVLNFSWKVISHILMNTPAAPLKNALLKAGIAKDVSGGYNNNLKQPLFSIMLKDSDPIHKDTFKSIFFDTLKEICEKGLDKELIEASININEFVLREADMGGYPTGFVYVYNSLSNWIRDYDPISCLTYENDLIETKASLTSKFYESLIQKYILQNNHYVFMTMKPVKGLAEKKHNDQREYLANIKKSMSEKEINDIIETKQKVLQRQTTPDTPDDLQKIPTLNISDVNPIAADFSLSESVKNGVTYLDHDSFTNGIVYLKLYFETNGLPQNLVPYASVLTYILGQIHTKNYHYTQLSNLINIHTGGFNFDYNSYAAHFDADSYRPFIGISSKALVPKTAKMVEMLHELTQNTVFDDDKRLLELLNELKSRYEMMLMKWGTYFATLRLSAYCSESGKFDEIIHGYEIYSFLKNTLIDFEKNKASIIDNFKKTYSMLFNRRNLYVSITSPQTDINTVKECLEPWINSLNDTVYEKVNYKFDFNTTNEAFVLPGNVQYVCKGYSFKKIGYEYCGDMEVLTNITGLDYLWNKIRVQGGAYGVDMDMLANGLVNTVSFRDPNIIETLNAYDELAQYLAEVEMDTREFEKYIIGAVRVFDTPRTPSMKSSIANTYYFKGKTKELIQIQRDQLLAADINKIKQYHKLINDVMRNGYICVFGSETKIKENSKLFNKIINVFG
jgi:hypothetical protein